MVDGIDRFGLQPALKSSWLNVSAPYEVGNGPLPRIAGDIAERLRLQLLRC